MTLGHPYAWLIRALTLLLLYGVALPACSETEDTMPHAVLSDTETMMGWIEAVVAQGIRRPGYPADDWVEGWASERFREFGLENVTLDPVTVKRWEPLACSLTVWHD